MSDPSTPERPEEVRDGEGGGDATTHHETTTPTENAPESSAPEPSAPEPAADAPPPEPAPEPTPEPAPVPTSDPTPEPAPEPVRVEESRPDEATPADTPADTPVDTPADAPTQDTPPADTPAEDTPAEDTPADTAPSEVAPVETAPTEAVPTEAVPEGAEPTPPAAETPTDEKPSVDAQAGDAAKKTPPKKRKERRPPAKVQRTALNAEQKSEARERARERFTRAHQRQGEGAMKALEFISQNRSLVFAGRFCRRETSGMDMRMLRQLRDQWLEVIHEEERRIELREVLRTHGALDEKTLQRLDRANSIPAMEDVAAPHLPVVAGRATVARGLGLEPLAEAIRKGEEGTVLSELAKDFVKEGAEEPAGVDAALAGARDILAEEAVLDAELRARLRKAFRREALLTVALRAERKGDPGRHKSLVGFSAPASKVPPLRFLAIRRGEKERVLVSTIEPSEEAVLPLLHRAACADDHLHAGFLRAAIEDGYRRILKPIFQGELRNELKRRADDAAMETFERNLRHRLLGPVGGPRATLGLRPDVTGGHRWCAIDTAGLPAGSGILPHEGTVGREPCLAELAEVLKTYEISAIAVGSGAGRATAHSLAEEVTKDSSVDVAIVSDGGTHALEAQGKLEIADRPEVPAECRGALSLARRFQDPLQELVTIDPKALALGPHLHDVHQGRLRLHLDETVEQCVAHVGVNPNTASEELLARVPGFTRQAARGFVAWRDAHGPLAHKAALAAVPGVGTDIADQAVGFLRLPDAEDARDRLQLHPSQYDAVEKMAEQVSAEVGALFGDSAVRSRIRLTELESEELSLPLLKYVLYQLTAGHLDERPKYARPIAPPPGLTLETLQPGLVLEGRVIRAMPFGVFVDVGLETDALIPTPHIGDHPGIEPATVAPIGAVVQARVLEVIPEKRRLTLSMRPDRAMYDRGPRRGGDRRGPPRRDGPRADARGGAGRGAAARGGAGAGAGAGARGGAGAGARGGAGAGARGGAGAGARGGAGGGARGGDRGRPSRKPQRKGGKFGGGTGGIGDIFSGRRRDDRGAPRRISLAADDDTSKSEDKIDEQNLTEEQLLKRKLEDLQKKFGGGDK